ncbi:MAG: replication initiator protein A [Proteobacteria bacterium]|nr:replication initiator protein A [Pseudomonadota bacterium]
MFDGVRNQSERERLDAFRALAADLAPRDLQDLMSYPFFSLTKAKRTRPIDYHAGDITIRVEGTTEHGIASIWDADVLIWAASQIIEARDAGIATSRLLVATPYEILSFIGRGTSGRDYGRLKAAFDRLQSTTVATSIRQPSSRRLHRFSWINEWKERSAREGKPLGLEVVLPDWFYATVLDSSLILTLDRAYFTLTGGIERWLYRLARKHAGKQADGWRFDFRHLHARSGSLARYSDFAIDLRRIARTGMLLGYRTVIGRSRTGSEVLHLRAAPRERVERTVAGLAARFRIGDNL